MRESKFQETILTKSLLDTRMTIKIQNLLQKLRDTYKDLVLFTSAQIFCEN
jgi:hypothetical protein